MQITEPVLGSEIAWFDYLTVRGVCGYVAQALRWLNKVSQDPDSAPPSSVHYLSLSRLVSAMPFPHKACNSHFCSSQHWSLYNRCWGNVKKCEVFTRSFTEDFLLCFIRLGPGLIFRMVTDMGSQTCRIGLKPVIIHFFEMGT